MITRARRGRWACAVVAATLAACGGDDSSSIEVVVIEAPPGLPQRLDRVDLTVSLVNADEDVTLRTVSAAARYGDSGLEPWTRVFRPESSSHPGRQLYRFRAAGIVAGTEYVVTQNRLVFVPRAHIVLPLRLRADCLDARCGRDETCGEGGVCIDDAVPPCSLVVGPPPPFCETMDAGGPDAGRPVDAAPADVRAPVDAGVDAGGPPPCAWGLVAGRCDDAVELAAGSAHACARRASGAVVCWGWNGNGQLGDGTMTDRSTPVAVAGLTDAVEITAGGEHTCARRASGSVVCWGRNDTGDLGDGTEMDRARPVAVSSLPDAVEVSAGQFHTCARHPSGSVVCWGWNAFGVLGDGMTAPRDTPVSVLGLDSAVELAAAWIHTCARRGSTPATPGTVDCWGGNTAGQLGDGSMTDRPRAAPVTGLADAVEISGYMDRTCARRASGAVVCWGSNGSGQLGDGSSTDRATPVPVTGLGDAVQIAVGDSHTCARRASGAVVCWGDNDRGELGDGTIDERHAPTAVLGLDDAVEVVSGSFHSCARRATGAVVCWGDDLLRELGDGAPHALCEPIGIPCSTTTVEVAPP